MKCIGPVLVLSTALSGGGAEAVARLMVQSIDDAECLLFENKAGIAITGHHIQVIPGFTAASLIKKFLVNVRRLIFVQYAKIQSRPRITISHLEGPNFTNLLTCFGGRRIIFVHNQVGQNYKGSELADKLKAVLVRLLYRRADKVICVSSDICTELIEKFGVSVDRVDLIPNPIDVNTIIDHSLSTYGDARDLLGEQHYLISIASLTPQKNHALLLRAYDELVRSDPNYSNFKLVLVGDGEERLKLKNLCSDLGLRTTTHGGNDLDLAAQVFFMGFQSNPFPLLRKANLLVMPSLWEGSPIALLEAMALGVPSIVSNCSTGVCDIFESSSTKCKQLTNDKFVRTPYGVLVTTSVDANQPATVSFWADLINQILTDDLYLDQCRFQAVKRASQNDLSEVKNIWKEKIFF